MNEILQVYNNQVAGIRKSNGSNVQNMPIKPKTKGNNVIVNGITMHYSDWNSIKSTCNGIDNIKSIEAIPCGCRVIMKDGSILENTWL